MKVSDLLVNQGPRRRDDLAGAHRSPTPSPLLRSAASAPSWSRASTPPLVGISQRARRRARRWPTSGADALDETVADLMTSDVQTCDGVDRR